MARYEEHVKSSLEAISMQDPEFFKQHQDALLKLIAELHSYMDQFFNTKGEGYDYTGIDVMKHWERLHHIEGIHQATDFFVSKYGAIYHRIVFQEASRHVRDDLGCVPNRMFYKQIGIWKRLRGF